MPCATLDGLRHSHDFAAVSTHHEARTRWVLWLTAVVMVLEIGTGLLSGSMALLADGWHMGTHMAAFAITLFAYGYARRHRSDPNFSFGTGKVGALGGFAGAVMLAVVALLIAVESVSRLLAPVPIHYHEAIAVAALGLAVNLLSAWLLHDDDAHHHEHAPDEPAHTDHNLRAAYFHVLADALTSVLAIVALFAAKWLGWLWVDASVGVLGALIISRWAYHLIRDTSAILLDANPDEALKQQIRATLEQQADTQVAEIHVWQVGVHRKAVILSLVSHSLHTPAHYRRLLGELPEIAHLTIEVNPCRHCTPHYSE